MRAKKSKAYTSDLSNKELDRIKPLIKADIPNVIEKLVLDRSESSCGWIDRNVARIRNTG